MKKGKYCAAVAAAILLLIGAGMRARLFDNEEIKLTAARTIAGEGMIRLMADERLLGETEVPGENVGVSQVGSDGAGEGDFGQAAQEGDSGDIAGSDSPGGQTGKAEKARGNTPRTVFERPKVALTFDDGPNAKYTPQLLEGLKERGIHVTFFLMGKNIEGNEDLVRQIQEEGHLIGNHTYNHVQLNKISEAAAKEEIEKTSNEIYEVTGVYPSYIRPPFGAWRKNLELSVTMFPVFWDIDTLDWKSKNVESVLQIVQSEIEDGSIILMHDGYQTSVDAALKITDLLTAEGYDFVTVDELVMP